MVRFLKVIILIFIVTAAALAAFYNIRKAEIDLYTHGLVLSKISEMTGYDIRSKTVSVSGLDSISLTDVNVIDPSSGKSLADISSVEISISIRGLIKKYLILTVNIRDMRSDNIIGDVFAKVYSDPSDSFSGIFSPDLLSSVFIIDSDLSAKDITLRKIRGVISIRERRFLKAKFSFYYGREECYTDISPTFDPEGYEINILSQMLAINSVIVPGEESFIIKGLSGMFYSVYFDLNGEVLSPFSEERRVTLSGEVQSDISSFSSLPGSIGDFSKEHSLSGKIKSTIFWELENNDIKNATTRMTLIGSGLTIDRMDIDAVEAKISVENGRLHAPLITTSFYGGAITSELRMDLDADDIPYMFSSIFTNIDFGELIADLSVDPTEIYGTLNATLDIEGYLRSPESMNGKLKLDITDADLGPMPLLTPLVGSIHGVLQNIVPQTRFPTLDEAHADFTIENEEIYSDNILLSGGNVSITGVGSLDFSGNLDFRFNNRFKEIPSGEDVEWQTVLKNTFIKLGNLLGTARLEGTLKEPKWTL